MPGPANLKHKAIFWASSKLHALAFVLGCVATLFITKTPMGSFCSQFDSNTGQRISSFSGGAGTDEYALAYRESGGFFNDIREADWNMLKERMRTTPECSNNCEAQPPHIWMQNNWEPAFTCLHERRLGLWGDGGKWVCDPHRIAAEAERSQQSCLVYSVGSNNDFGFEEAILQNISSDCEVHTFDPTVGEHPSNLPAHGKIQFHPWGLAAVDKNEYKTMATIRKELGHAQREVDILKIDCEGCEWDTYMTWFDDTLPPRQILIELHDGTSGSSPVVAMRFMRYLKDHGYVIFHKEPNTLGCYGKCIEYSFLRLDALSVVNPSMT